MARRESLPFLHPVRVDTEQRTVAHMAAALLLDYPTPATHEQGDLLRTATASLPRPVSEAFGRFWTSRGPWPSSRRTTCPRSTSSAGARST